jgi:hypothetical protein
MHAGYHVYFQYETKPQQFTESQGSLAAEFEGEPESFDAAGVWQCFLVNMIWLTRNYSFFRDKKLLDPTEIIFLCVDLGLINGRYCRKGVQRKMEEVSRTLPRVAFWLCLLLVFFMELGGDDLSSGFLCVVLSARCGLPR